MPQGYAVDPSVDNTGTEGTGSKLVIGWSGLCISVYCATHPSTVLSRVLIVSNRRMWGRAYQKQQWWKE